MEEVMGQKVIEGGKGAKEGGHPGLNEKNIGETGAAKKAEDGKGVNTTNTPDGQKMAG